VTSTRTANRADDVRQRVSRIRLPPALGNRQRVGPLVNESLEIRFVDDVLRTDLARPEPSRPDPATDRLRVAPGAPSSVWNGEHVAAYYNKQRVGFANSRGGFVFVDESAEEVAAV